MSETKGAFRIHFITKPKEEMTAEDIRDFRNETHERLDLAIDEIFSTDPGAGLEPGPSLPSPL